MTPKEINDLGIKLGELYIIAVSNQVKIENYYKNYSPCNSGKYLEIFSDLFRKCDDGNTYLSLCFNIKIPEEELTKLNDLANEAENFLKTFPINLNVFSCLENTNDDVFGCNNATNTLITTTGEDSDPCYGHMVTDFKG